jgi:excisionase family DNA binding protein
MIPHQGDHADELHFTRREAIVSTTGSELRLLLRIEEAAERLGIGRSLMYELVLSGKVESVRLGRLRRIPEECLHEHVDRLRSEARQDRVERAPETPTAPPRCTSATTETGTVA